MWKYSTEELDLLIRITLPGRLDVTAITDQFSKAAVLTLLRQIFSALEKSQAIDL